MFDIYDFLIVLVISIDILACTLLPSYWRRRDQQLAKQEMLRQVQAAANEAAACRKHEETIAAIKAGLEQRVEQYISGYDWGMDDTPHPMYSTRTYWSTPNHKQVKLEQKEPV